MKGLGDQLRAEARRVMAARNWKTKDNKALVFYKNPYSENIVAHIVVQTDYTRGSGVPWKIHPLARATYLDYYNFEKKYLIDLVPSWHKDPGSLYVTWEHAWLQPEQAFEDYSERSRQLEYFYEFDATKVESIVDLGEETLEVLVQRYPSIAAIWEQSAANKNPFEPGRWDFTKFLKMIIFLGRYDQIDRLFEADEASRKWVAKFHEKPVEPRSPELDRLREIAEQVKRDRGEA